MDGKRLYVMAGFDSDTERLLASIQEELNHLGFVGEQTKAIPPHITLADFDIDKESELVESLGMISKKHSVFKISFSHVGIFQGSRVLFVAPDVNKDLLDLKGYFGSSHNWAAHVTLLIDDPLVIQSAVPPILARFRAFEGRIESLFLYEFWPTRFVASSRLG